jgi:hypothetical protein
MAATTAPDAAGSALTAAAAPAAESDVEMAVAEALAEVLSFPDVAFDAAAAAVAMDVMVRQPQLPAHASVSSAMPMDDERAPTITSSAPTVGSSARADGYMGFSLRGRAPPGKGSTKKQPKQPKPYVYRHSRSGY